MITLFILVYSTIHGITFPSEYEIALSLDA